MIRALLICYLLSYVVILMLALYRGGRRERDKAVSLIASLSLLIGVLRWRLGLTGGEPVGAVAVGLALNASLIFGTKFDPMNAVVRWPGEASKKREVRSMRRADREKVVRYKSNVAPLTMFFLTAGGICLLRPDWFGM